MKPGLSLRVSQHLSLTPQLQQSIQLLQLSTLELAQEVEQMLGDNPFLEVAGDDDHGPESSNVPTNDAAPQAGDDLSLTSPQWEAAAETAADAAETSGTAESLSWEGDGQSGGDDGEWGGDAGSSRTRGQGDDDELDATELARSGESLTEYLHRQAMTLRLGEVDRAALRFLIENLNDDGYLEDSLEELARGLGGDDIEECEELVHRFTVALRLLQSLEPVGVGARDLAECLQLQLRDQLEDAEREGEDDEALAVLRTALDICAQPMDLLARRDLRKLAVLCGARDELLREALALIARLEPRPGRRFADVQRQIVVPDVIVRPVRSGAGRLDFSVQLNPDVMPKLRVHDIYASALRGHRGSEGHAALQQRLQEARWFIKNIQQRFDTILRVSQAIVERQKNFFVHGELAMRPLVLRDIADALGLHESTISRVTTAKYMATPQGTYELKYFFGSGLGTETGGNASSTAVRALIKQFVGAEDPKKPLSDNQLADMLKEQGIECARRTVAKYRELLKIPPTTLRKAL
ncbi:RNA polymerase factor sigma-54 [Delftia sp. PS-11]|uniref:RNA polymerase factor sigma-54 n=1 Tax=Delftia sp. PS-11 TaxID=2767222 RepID=UPI002456084A|nr:RNA polymerase factor sigma-54 [Delftia sp. PS-11]KAJ8743123.1 RNA polymerase factor sigma-54 [Delftia sp. PS-11]